MIRVVPLVLVAWGGVARAEIPHDLVARPITLAADQIAADVSFAYGLDKGYTGTPVSLSPDVWFGLPRDVTIGVTTSDASLDHLDAGASICVRTGEACTRALHGGALDVRVGVMDGALAIAPRVRVLVRDVDPWKPAVTGGALVRWTRGRFAISGDPYLRLGLANTERGNRAAVVVPVWFALQPGARWLLAFHTGYDSELAVASSGFHIPTAILARFAATPHVDLSVEGGFRSALGPQTSSGYRALIVMFGFRT